MSTLGDNVSRDSWREKIFIIIFGHETPAGKTFDISLILCIIASVVVVILDSVKAIQANHGLLLQTLEWIFTIIFTIEYVLRIICVRRPLRYMTSFFGIIDLLSIIPSYIGLFFPVSRYLMVIRFLRVLRIFRVLKITKYIGESNLLMEALWASRRKILVFLFAVLTIATIFGSFMYVIEGEKYGFTSIPKGIYWAIVTLTTVGYGELRPQTSFGQFIAAIIMIMGYGIIAVPTGIVTSEIAQASKTPRQDHQCSTCKASQHEDDAKFCRHCGALLHPE